MPCANHRRGHVGDCNRTSCIHCIFDNELAGVNAIAPIAAKRQSHELGNFAIRIWKSAGTPANFSAGNGNTDAGSTKDEPCGDDSLIPPAGM